MLIFVFFSATLFNKGFLDPNNLLNILRQTAMISIMTVGMTYVLAAGEIDLSIGMVAGLASLVVAVGMDWYGPVVGVLAGCNRLHRRAHQRRSDDARRHSLVPDDPRHDGHRARHGDVDDADQVRAEFSTTPISGLLAAAVSDLCRYW